MEKAAAEAAYAALHNEKSKRQFHNGDFTRWADVWSPETPYPWDGGVKVYVSPVDIDPDDDFTTRHDAQPAALRPSEPEEVDDGGPP